MFVLFHIFFSEVFPFVFELSINLPAEFPFEIKDNRLHLSIELPVTYPNDACLISVLNEDIPPKIRRIISEEAKKRAEIAYAHGKQTKMVQNMMKWLFNNLEKLMVDTAITNVFEITN